MANRLLAQFLSLSFLWDCLGHLCVSRARLHAEKPIRFRSFSHVVPFNPISTVWFSCFTLFSIPFFSHVVCFCGNFQYIYLCFLANMCMWCQRIYRMKKEIRNFISFSRKFFSFVCYHYLCCSFFILSISCILSFYPSCQRFWSRLYSYPQENQDLYLLCMLYVTTPKCIPLRNSNVCRAMCSLKHTHCTFHSEYWTPSTQDALCLKYMYANCHFANHSILHVCLCFKSTKICSTSILRFSTFE